MFPLLPTGYCGNDVLNAHVLIHLRIHFVDIYVIRVLVYLGNPPFVIRLHLYVVNVYVLHVLIYLFNIYVGDTSTYLCC